jgi:hypothetical protein
MTFTTTARVAVAATFVALWTAGPAGAQSFTGPQREDIEKIIKEYCRRR